MFGKPPGAKSRLLLQTAPERQTATATDSYRQLQTATDSSDSYIQLQTKDNYSRDRQLKIAKHTFDWLLAADLPGAPARKKISSSAQPAPRHVGSRDTPAPLWPNAGQ